MHNFLGRNCRLFGCYEALTAGKARDAMVDMTGGVGEGLEIADFRSQDQRMRLFNILHKAKGNDALMCAAIQVGQKWISFSYIHSVTHQLFSYFLTIK